jgi:cell division protein FtsB
MPLTTSERATLVAAIEAIPVSDVDVAALQQQLQEAQATIASLSAENEALIYGIGQLEAKVVAARAAIETARLSVVAADTALV